MRRHSLVLLPALALLVAGLSACGSDDGAGADDRPTVVVTTTILGDVVGDLVGDRAEVQVLMPPGADPHDVQISARQAAELREADALIANGGGFEAGFLDALEAAEADGVPLYEALDAVDALTFDDEHDHAEEGDDHAEEGDGEDHADEGDEDDHADEDEDDHADEGGDDHAEEGDEDDHADEGDEDDHADEGDEDDHDHEGVDPHFFTDPDRMADAAEGIAAFLAAEVPALATDDFRAGATATVEGLRALAVEVDEILAPLPAEDRILVTNHEVFGYFADRYDFEVVGVVVPGGGTGAEPSARDLDRLASVIEAEGVSAVFADVSSPRRLADALAAEVGDVEVVVLFSESLGEEGSGGASYQEMVRTNAERIVAALS